MSDRLAAMVKSALDNGLRGRPTPLILLMEPTHRCNASCPFCYHWQEDTHEEISIERQEEMLHEAFDLGARFLYVSGGEPTLFPHLERLLMEARRVGYWTSMTTNGFTLARRVDALAPLLDGVTVSVDHASSLHDTFRRLPGLYSHAVRGLIAAKTAGLETRINMSLGRSNRDQIPAMVTLSRDVGAALHVRLLTRESPDVEADALSWPEARKAATEILELKERHPRIIATPKAYLRHIRDERGFRCRLLSLLITVDAQGRLYVPCPRFEGAKETLAGRLKEQSLEEAWHSPQADVLRAQGLSCTAGLDCYTSCILDISLLANLSPEMLWEQLFGGGSLLSYFRGGG